MGRLAEAAGAAGLGGSGACWRGCSGLGVKASFSFLRFPFLHISGLAHLSFLPGRRSHARFGLFFTLYRSLSLLKNLFLGPRAALLLSGTVYPRNRMLMLYETGRPPRRLGSGGWRQAGRPRKARGQGSCRPRWVCPAGGGVHRAGVQGAPRCPTGAAGVRAQAGGEVGERGRRGNSVGPNIPGQAAYTRGLEVVLEPSAALFFSPSLAQSLGVTEWVRYRYGRNFLGPFPSHLIDNFRGVCAHSSGEVHSTF